MLTTEQQAILKTDVEADPILMAFPHNSDGAFAIAAAYQELASPDFIVWNSNVTQDEIMQNGFDWTRIDNLTVGPAGG